LLCKEEFVAILDRFRLDGRVAIVTGASSGLGAETARQMASAGARLAIGARRAEKLTELCAEMRSQGHDVVAIPFDVSSPDECQRFVARTIEAFGQVDVLVNNAGIATAVPATRETPQGFTSVLEVNLFGTYWMAQAVARAMASGGSIVNISSVLALTTAGLPQAAYSASKAGVIGLTRDLAQQWTARKNIRVNAIAPGYFATEMTAAYDPGYVESLVPRMLMGRQGQLEELAAAVIFLASDASSYITGTVLTVDGGFTVT
jgi:NAD(P)-dependent dehydrogenase (short-subunit alcohol dehydrogenase family)